MTLTTNPDTIAADETNVELVCTVELGLAVAESDLSLLTVNVRLSRDGIVLAPTGPTVVGTRFIYSFRMESFTVCDNGNYVCTATVSLVSPSPYITGNATVTGQAKVAVGKTKNNSVMYSI